MGFLFFLPQPIYWMEGYSRPGHLSESMWHVEQNDESRSWWFTRTKSYRTLLYIGKCHFFPTSFHKYSIVRKTCSWPHRTGYNCMWHQVNQPARLFHWPVLITPTQPAGRPSIDRVQQCEKITNTFPSWFLFEWPVSGHPHKTLPV